MILLRKFKFQLYVFLCFVRYYEVLCLEGHCREVDLVKLKYLSTGPERSQGENSPQ